MLDSGEFDGSWNEVLKYGEVVVTILGEVNRNLVVEDADMLAPFINIFGATMNDVGQDRRFLGSHPAQLHAAKDAARERSRRPRPRIRVYLFHAAPFCYLSKSYSRNAGLIGNDASGVADNMVAECG
jgi:hypothetical protein